MSVVEELASNPLVLDCITDNLDLDDMVRLAACNHTLRRLVLPTVVAKKDAWVTAVVDDMLGTTKRLVHHLMQGCKVPDDARVSKYPPMVSDIYAPLAYHLPNEADAVSHTGAFGTLRSRVAQTLAEGQTCMARNIQFTWPSRHFVPEITLRLGARVVWLDPDTGDEAHPVVPGLYDMVLETSVRVYRHTRGESYPEFRPFVDPKHADPGITLKPLALLVTRSNMTRGCGAWHHMSMHPRPGSPFDHELLHALADSVKIALPNTNPPRL